MRGPMSRLANAIDRALPQGVEAIYDSVANVGRWHGDQFGSISVSCGDPALLRDYGSEVPFFTAVPKMDIDMRFTVGFLLCAARSRRAAELVGVTPLSACADTWTGCRPGRGR